MCGIAGFIGYTARDPEHIDATLASMRRRGPDGQTHACLRVGNLYVDLLHARLSIIDLDPRSNQPFARGESSVSFNGEIYNYIEVREELIRQGCHFSTESDTEVLVQAYNMWGAACVDRLEGMWAFALVDSAAQRLVLSRDRFGEKPLYLMRTAEGVYFGSEVKFIRALSGRRLTPNRRQILRFLVDGYRTLYARGETFFEEIEEVPAAHQLMIDGGMQLAAHRYWDLRSREGSYGETEAVEGIRHHLSESVKIRLRADVPIAFCLSGGVDSSALASIAAKSHGCDVACYSIIDPDPRYNEERNISATVNDLGCSLTKIHLGRERSLDRLRALVEYHDTPIATVSYYIHSFLSEAISRDGRRVVFSGTGADELFTGYYHHYLLHLSELEKAQDPRFAQAKADWERHIQPLVRNPLMRDLEAFARASHRKEYLRLDNDVFASYLQEPFDEEWREMELASSPLHNRLLNELFAESIPVILHEDDLNSMRFSIENRSPFLDSKLAEFAFSIPRPLLIKNGYGKYLLREAMDGILNDTVRLDREKRGFNAAIESVFDTGSAVFREEVLAEGPLYQFVRRGAVEAVLEREEWPNSFSKFLFSLLSVKLFLESA